MFYMCHGQISDDIPILGDGNQPIIYNIYIQNIYICFIGISKAAKDFHCGMDGHVHHVSCFASTDDEWMECVSFRNFRTGPIFVHLGTF